MCYCDYDSPEFYHSEQRIARKRHRCSECSGYIQPSETYEHVWGKWEGDVSVHKTCSRCVELRRFVADETDCPCIVHGNLIEHAIETAREYANGVPGLLFGARRRQILIYRHKKRTSHAPDITPLSA